ncbi:GNAT family N-acetyltransferase [Paenibacillus cremeus]|uniref:Acetyltransferase n=1 Tax=Paenibacillus cremeus TaxID=2163881 RepID=A0A559KH45_9BACL|nr:GNAT family N-acetyltransferase [Paenibacillus cremeus]TVY11457.1 acetyltransferase [Paenibacillus cremeus]
MLLFTTGLLSVRRLTEKDAQLLVQWLNNPEVLQYYEGRDRPHDADKVREHFYAEGEPVSRCIVLYAGKAIGYIQFYPISDMEYSVYGYDPQRDEVYGMDQFIGETSYWNRGIGTALIRAMVHYITNTIGATRVVMDPQAWNKRALACYEKCGFRKVKLLPDHECHEGALRDCWQVEYIAEGEA